MSVQNTGTHLHPAASSNFHNNDQQNGEEYEGQPNEWKSNESVPEYHPMENLLHGQGQIRIGQKMSKKMSSPLGETLIHKISIQKQLDLSYGPPRQQLTLRNNNLYTNILLILAVCLLLAIALFLLYDAIFGRANNTTKCECPTMPMPRTNGNGTQINRR